MATNVTDSLDDPKLEQGGSPAIKQQPIRRRTPTSSSDDVKEHPSPSGSIPVAPGNKNFALVKKIFIICVLLYLGFRLYGFLFSDPERAIVKSIKSDAWRQRIEELQQLFEDLETQHNELDEKREKWDAVEATMAANFAKHPTKINLNIGGTKFATSKATLLKHPNSYFASMLRSSHTQQNEDELFIDRNPKHFSLILDFLRTSTLVTQDLSTRDLQELKADFEFYHITFPKLIGPMGESELLSLEMQKTISDWIPNSKFTRIYQATVDGFSTSAFHAKCDNSSLTLMVIQSTRRYLFGGFATWSWDPNNYSNTNAEASSFLFTLTNPYSTAPTKFILRSYFNLRGSGSSVQFGNDLILSTDPHKHQSSVGFPYYYSDTSGYGNVIFTGSAAFLAKEIEVFQVDKKITKFE